MQEAYQKVGLDYEVKDDRLVGGIGRLQARRWPLARLTFPLRKVIDQLDRVLAGCCWKVLISNPKPSESLQLLQEASKGLTLLLAGWLAEEIAFMLRKITFHPSQKLYDDDTIHLLCANYWLLPIYQELLHTATRYNVTSEGERKRPCSGLAKILAHEKPVKTQAKRQNKHTKTVSDWIGGLCDADSLYVWFPAHWVPHLLRRLEAREDEYRQNHLMWFDRDLPDDKLLEDQKKAKAGRKLQFGIRPYDDDNVRQLTGSIRANWLSLPLNDFCQQLQQVRKGVVTGVFQAKVALPWAETSAPRLQVFLFLPNGTTMDQWYKAVFGLPLSWPEITAMNPEYMHPASAYGFHDLRKIFRVPGMWGKFTSEWNLLGKHLYNNGPNYYTEEERAEKLVPSKSRLPSEVLKDTRRPSWQS